MWLPNSSSLVLSFPIQRRLLTATFWGHSSLIFNRCSWICERFWTILFWKEKKSLASLYYCLAGLTQLQPQISRILDFPESFQFSLFLFSLRLAMFPLWMVLSIWPGTGSRSWAQISGNPEGQEYLVAIIIQFKTMVSEVGRRNYTRLHKNKYSGEKWHRHDSFEAAHIDNNIFRCRFNGKANSAS